jgi:hypothetical protein
MNEKFKIHLQGTADTRQWAAANGILGKLEGSADRFVDTLRAGVGIDLGGRLVSGLASLPGVFKEILDDGVEYNRVMQGAEIGIANLLGKFKELDKVSAKNAAAEAMKAMAAEEPRAAATMRQLLDGFQSTIAPSHALGFSVQENIKLVADFSNVMNNLRLDATQMNQELNSILSGNIGPDSSVAQRLRITNEGIKKARESGRVLEYLTEKFDGLEQAGDGFDVVMSSLESVVEKLQGTLAKPLFDKTVEGAQELMDVLNQPEVLQALTDIGIGIGALINMGVSLGQWAEANSIGVNKLAEALSFASFAIPGLRPFVERFKQEFEKVRNEQMQQGAASTPAQPSTSVGGGSAESSASTSGASGSFGGGSSANGTREDSFALALEKSRAALGDQTSQLMVLEEEYRLIVESMDKATTLALEGMDAAQLINAAFENQTGEPWSGEMLENLKAAASKAAEIKTLKEQIDQQAIQENERLRKAAADTARANAEVKADEAKVALALDAERAEIAITAAKAAGQDAVAKQLEDQQRINALARGYRDELKLSASEAQALAEQRVTSERQLSDRNEADSGGGGGSDLDRLISRAQASAQRRTDGPLTAGGGLAGLRDLQRNRFALTSRLSDSSPLTPGGGLADFKGNSGAVNSAGKGGADAVNLGPNGAASQAKGAADAMGRLVTQITARDAATAAELSRLKGLVSELERRIAQNAQITANNRT